MHKEKRLNMVESKNYPQSSGEKQKKCTDALWLCIFILFCFSMILIAVLSVKNTYYHVILKGYDSFGNICGSEYNKRYENFSQSGMDTSSKKYLYYLDIINTPTVFKVCIKECYIQPRLSVDIVIEFWTEIETMLCQYENSNGKDEPRPLRYCPVINLFNSTIYRHRCIPKMGNEHVKGIYKAVSAEDFAEMFFIASYLSWTYVWALSGIALFLSMSLWVIINYLTDIICWIICTLVVFCNSGLCILLLHEHNKQPQEYNYKNFTDVKTSQYYFLEEAIINRMLLYVFTVILAISMITFFFIFIFLRKYFSEITLLFNETFDCWKKLKNVMVIPLFALLLIIIVLSFWSYVMLCLTTASYSKIFSISKKIEGEENFRTFNRIEYVGDNYIRNLIWIYIFGILWITEFIVAGEQFTVGISIVHYYFQLPGRSTSGNHVFFQLIKHHLGTIAKGSFIFTIWKFPQLIILNGGKIARQINCKPFIIHIFDWLEEKIGFLSPCAYTMVAMEKIDLCPAGKKAWKIMTKSPKLLRSVNSMTIIMLFFVKLIIALLTCIIGVPLLNNLNDLHLFTAPLILSTVFAYCIANIVFSFLEITLDTICLCVCEDSRINNHVTRSTKTNLAFLMNQYQTDIQKPAVTITNS